MFVTIIAAVLSVLGFVLKNEYLYIGCGFISFISFLAFINQDFEVAYEVEYADLREDYPLNHEEIIKKERFANIGRRFVLCVLIFGTYIWLFSWQIIIWSGIIFGFYLIPRYLKVTIPIILRGNPR